jgi:hypothetical protein
MFLPFRGNALGVTQSFIMGAATRRLGVRRRSATLREKGPLASRRAQLRQAALHTAPLHFLSCVFVRSAKAPCEYRAGVSATYSPCLPLFMSR